MNAPPFLISTAVHLVALIALTLPFAARQREPSLVLLEPSPTAAQQVSGGAALEVAAPPQGAAEMSVASRDEAVGSALAWLADVQHADGGWSQPREAADVESTTCALLAFASAGQTHKQGKYAKQVAGGLQFLASRGDALGGKPPTGLRFPSRSNPQRAQALATLALATLYSMSHDKGLVVPSQLAVNELCDQPVTAQETAEVIGWRLLALKEAHQAYLRIPPEVIQSLKDTCDERALAAAHVSCEKIEPGTLLVRLECRSAVGPNPHLQLEWLREQRQRGRSRAENYFTAFTACHHRPTEAVYPYLKFIEADVLSSVEDRELEVEQTSLGVMILRVWPRHMIFGSSAAEDDFPL